MFDDATYRELFVGPTNVDENTPPPTKTSPLGISVARSGPRRRDARRRREGVRRRVMLHVAERVLEADDRDERGSVQAPDAARDHLASLVAANRFEAIAFHWRPGVQHRIVDLARVGRAVEDRADRPVKVLVPPATSTAVQVVAAGSVPVRAIEGEERVGRRVEDLARAR